MAALVSQWHEAHPLGLFFGLTTGVFGVTRFALHRAILAYKGASPARTTDDDVQSVDGAVCAASGAVASLALTQLPASSRKSFVLLAFTRLLQVSLRSDRSNLTSIVVTGIIQ